jgi:hypothetical protein
LLAAAVWGIAWAFTCEAPRPYVWLAVAVSALGTWLLGGGSLSSFSTRVLPSD